jgi:N-acetylneuraminic acid mutarotase
MLMRQPWSGRVKGDAPDAARSRPYLVSAYVSLLMLSSPILAGCSGAPVELTVMSAPALPDPVGFAGMGAGDVNGTLIAVGGAHFPDKRPWEGGIKVFNKSVYAFEHGAWRVAGELPGAMAYPAYAGTPEGLVIAGGTDDKTNFRSVFRVSLKGGEVALETLPGLPTPTAFAACAVWRGKLVVIGGTDSPGSTVASNAVYTLDLANPAKGWTTLPPLPGRGRQLAVAGVHGGNLYVFGGCALSPDAAGNPFRTYLRETLVLGSEHGAWKRVADLPEPLVAAAGPAPVAGDALLLLGGDTGFFHNNGKSPAEHPGQPTTIYGYRPDIDTYAVAGRLPVGVVTAPAVEYRGGVWIISGEIGPGRRTNTVTVIGRK